MPRAGAKPRTGNRTDLPQPATQPPTAATGQPYGHAGAQIASQQVVPLARQGVGAVPGGPSTPPGADPAATLAAFTNMQPPSATPNLNAPTARPGEQITAGLGNAAMAAAPVNLMGTLSQTLNQIALRSGSADLALLARVAEGAGQ